MRKLKNEINLIKNNFDKKIQELSAQVNYLTGKSNILYVQTFAKLIEDAIREKREEIKNKKIEWKLIYKASRDGFCWILFY